MKRKRVLVAIIIVLVLVLISYFTGFGFDYIKDYFDRAAVPEISINITSEQQEYNVVENEWNYKGLFGTFKNKEGKFQEYEETPTITIDDAGASFSIGLSKTPSSFTVDIKNLNNEEVNTFDGYSQNLPIPEYAGEYEYYVSIEWNQVDEYDGNIDLMFILDANYPIEFEFYENTIKQGQIVEMIAKNAYSADQIDYNDGFWGELEWFEYEGFMKTYIATNYSTQPGEYEISLEDIETSNTKKFLFEVFEKEYKVQNLWIDPTIEETTRSEQAYAEMDEYYAPVRLNSNSYKYYTNEQFLLPVEGILTTEFAEMRRVNDQITTYRHDGIDIGAPMNTEILASNTGEIVFARNMTLTGNTIIIDHGEGIFSVYMHLNEFKVAQGEMVERGQLIGLVGTTGFSTGPHLHFTISYYVFPLEPGYLIFGETIKKETHEYLYRK